jgi:hypothetical protein
MLVIKKGTNLCPFLWSNLDLHRQENTHSHINARTSSLPEQIGWLKNDFPKDTILL